MGLIYVYSILAAAVVGCLGNALNVRQVSAPLSAAGYVHRGAATWYEQHGVAGSCGAVHSDSDFLIAISGATRNQHCWQIATITNIGGGVKNNGVGNCVQAMVVDTCPENECDIDHLDLSVAAFKALTGGELDPPGKIEIEWSLN